MSTAQIIIIGLGAILILSSIDLSSFFKTATTIPVKPVEPVKIENQLVTIVEKWSNFKDICQANGLTEAVAKLDEIFPTLIKTEK